MNAQLTRCAARDSNPEPADYEKFTPSQYDYLGRY
jgi:hypothetical protein